MNVFTTSNLLAYSVIFQFTDVKIDFTLVDCFLKENTKKKMQCWTAKNKEDRYRERAALKCNRGILVGARSDLMPVSAVQAVQAKNPAW